MNEQQAIEKMVAPGEKRPGKWREGVIQIWLTRACDKACFGCTQGSNLGGNPGMMTLENFELAVKSLKDYFGVVGIFGGNPALHPQFPQMCEILREHIPFEQRGLWCNHPKGNGKVMRETFNSRVSNLNVHLDREAYDEFKRDWPECMPVGLDKDSRHSPVYASMRDFGIPEDQRWELISQCDINQHWSSMIGQFRGEARAWFCEIAGAQAMLKQHNQDYPDTGVDISLIPDWWKLPMSFYADQVRHHCHDCGVPLKGHGELSQSNTGTEQTTEFWRDVYKPKIKERPLELVAELPVIQPNGVGRVIDYIQNGQR